MWGDLWAPLILAVTGGGIATFWPWLQIHWRGVKFQKIISRELEELAPVPPTPELNTPWWEHLRKRFVHEEVFAREHVSANRDFLLSLSPDVVYNVSQLWIAYEQRNAQQWLHFLDALAEDRRVTSAKLCAARDDWHELLGADASVASAPRARGSAGAEPGGLLDTRLEAYAPLVALTRYGSEAQPLALSEEDRGARADALMDWFYAGGGLLLSSEAHVAFRRAHAQLTDAAADDAQRRVAFSALRTELKIDLGVRHADVRHVEMAAIS